MPNNRLAPIINQNNMYRAKSLNDISLQRDILKIINRENVKLNPNVKNRAEDINNAASISRLVRRFSKFSSDKNSKSRGVFL
jgi:hypothetical protein